MSRLWYGAILVCLLATAGTSAAERLELDLSGHDWGIARDWDAEWITNTLYLPPIDITRLPVNPPSWGWDRLNDQIEVTTNLPATIEQYFWGDNGNTMAIAGDYRGVSWWVTEVNLPAKTAGQRIMLDFESVHLRAEVYVNRQLAGYDIIGETPFSVDITGTINPGTRNEIAVRITDPLGNFNWNDRAVMHWGPNDIPASHGFGGITGRVRLRAVDPVAIEDIWAKNTPDISTVELVSTVRNDADADIAGIFTVSVHEWSNPDAVVFRKTYEGTVIPGVSTFTITAECPDVTPWDLEHPALYTTSVSFTAADGSIKDTATRRFGFRWFDIGGNDSDRWLTLNGRRTVLLGGMSWGFWPVNGTFPTPEMARVDIAAAKAMGLNYMNFHRAIGQPGLIEAADERGLLTYEEPGGYSCEGADPDQTLWRQWRRIKLMRMVKRDRSSPSMVIYNLQNRSPNKRSDEDVANMLAAHELDPTRIMTFISGFWQRPPAHDPAKLVLAPNSFELTDYGWFDMHNHTGIRSYDDRYYNGPGDYLRYHDDPGEVIFWGEDGGLFSPPRLQRIREYYDTHPSPLGWQGQRFLDWFEAYNRFLDRSGWRRYFPDVDAFTTSMGAVTLHYHGRIIENVRAGNIGDAYTINGWAAPRLANQAEIADLYRNPSADPEIMARYCRPSYVAVKLRDRVLPVGSSATADIFMINETDLSGSFELTVTMHTEDGLPLFEQSWPVTLEGGETYGQLLVEGLELPRITGEGRHVLTARLTGRRGEIAATGADELFSVGIAVSWLPVNGAVIDTTGVLARAIESVWGAALPVLGTDMPAAGTAYVILGPHRPDRDLYRALLDRVADGLSLIVLAHADAVAEVLATDDYQALTFSGSYPVGNGKLIAGGHRILDGLPQGEACGWEYQVFNDMNRNDSVALSMTGAQPVIAAVTGNRLDVGEVLSVVPFMHGQVVLSTLPVMTGLTDKSSQSVVAKRLLENMIRFAAASSSGGTEN